MSPKVFPPCPRCGAMLSERVSRSLWIKLLFFWLPVRRYYCGKCCKRSYVIERAKSK